MTNDAATNGAHARIFSVVPCADLVGYHAEGVVVGLGFEAITNALRRMDFRVIELGSRSAIVARKGSLLVTFGASCEFTVSRVADRSEVEAILSAIVADREDERES